MSNIAVFLQSHAWDQAIDHTSPYRGLGGRETALVSLAMEWANLGHDVWAFVPRESPDDINKLMYSSGGTIHWLPSQHVLAVAPALDLDLFVSWENTDVFAKLGDIDIGHRVLHLQVAHVHSDVPISSVCDDVAVLSEWAAGFLLEQHSDIADRLVVLPNGVDLTRFEIVEQEKVDDGCVDLIYSSSPDRGLHHLLKMFNYITRAIDDVYNLKTRLHVCYGAETWLSHAIWSHREEANRALAVRDGLKQDGVIYHGKVGQDVLAELMVNADLMTYPFDPMSGTETGCITICEALAARTPVVTTNGDCLGEDYGRVTLQVPLPIDYEQYVAAVVDALDPEDYLTRAQIGYEFVQDRSWKRIAQRWITEFSVGPIGKLVEIGD